MRRLIVNNRCPLCGEHVEMVKDSILKQEPHHSNAELIVTKRGLSNTYTLHAGTK